MKKWIENLHWRPEEPISYWEWVLGTQVVMLGVFVICKYYIPSGWRENLAAFIIGLLSSMLIGRWGRRF